MRDRILVVEDDPNTREALESLLTEQGYEVETASDGEETTPGDSSWGDYGRYQISERRTVPAPPRVLDTYRHDHVQWDVVTGDALTLRRVDLDEAGRTRARPAIAVPWRSIGAGAVLLAEAACLLALARRRRARWVA